MAQIALADFLRPPHDDPDLARRLRDLPSCPIPVPRVLVCGGPRRWGAGVCFVCVGMSGHVALPPPDTHTQLRTNRTPNSGKTSLLFSYAHSVAAAGGRVVFLCQRAKLEQAPPLLPAGVSRGDAAFERVDIKCA